MCCPENEQITGKVTGFKTTKAGEIAFVSTKEYGTITVLLNNTCWRGTGRPQRGEVIVILGLTRFPRGWRAIQARKFTRADEGREN